MDGLERNEQQKEKADDKELDDTSEQPEEGEIIDDFEVISSEDECSMRARIQELEDRNREIERINVISKGFVNPHGKYYSY